MTTIRTRKIRTRATGTGIRRTRTRATGIRRTRTRSLQTNLPALAPDQRVGLGRKPYHGLARVVLLSIIIVVSLSIATLSFFHPSLTTSIPPANAATLSNYEGGTGDVVGEGGFKTAYRGLSPQGIPNGKVVSLFKPGLDYTDSRKVAEFDRELWAGEVYNRLYNLPALGGTVQNIPGRGPGLVTDFINGVSTNDEGLGTFLRMVPESDLIWWRDYFKALANRANCDRFTITDPQFFLKRGNLGEPNLPILHDASQPRSLLNPNDYNALAERSSELAQHITDELNYRRIGGASGVKGFGPTAPMSPRNNPSVAAIPAIGAGLSGLGLGSIGSTANQAIGSFGGVGLGGLGGGLIPTGYEQIAEREQIEQECLRQHNCHLAHIK